MDRLLGAASSVSLQFVPLEIWWNLWHCLTNSHIIRSYPMVPNNENIEKLRKKKTWAKGTLHSGEIRSVYIVVESSTAHDHCDVFHDAIITMFWDASRSGIAFLLGHGVQLSDLGSDTVEKFGMRSCRHKDPVSVIFILQNWRGESNMSEHMQKLDRKIVIPEKPIPFRMFCSI